jgi:hypothetical protein
MPAGEARERRARHFADRVSSSSEGSGPVAEMITASVTCASTWSPADALDDVVLRSLTRADVARPEDVERDRNERERVTHQNEPGHQRRVRPGYFGIVRAQARERLRSDPGN